MVLAPYTYTGPLDPTITPDRSYLRDKSVIVTGGANGMGESVVRHFVGHGAFVTFADVNDERGRGIETELNDQYGQRCIFVKCDVRSWAEQKVLFETAKSKSPCNSVDVVLANAGISRSSGDSLWDLDDPEGEATEPNLNTLRVNLDGTFYTWKLAVHYFRKQPATEDRDRCFIITGSMTAYIDTPGYWQYTASKSGLLGFMRTARRSSHEQGVRINYVAPHWVRSAIRTPEYQKYLTGKGVEFAEHEDVAACMMRIACDKTVNGRSVMIVPRCDAERGFVDTDREDYTRSRDGQDLFWRMQELQLEVVQNSWAGDHFSIVT